MLDGGDVIARLEQRSGSARVKPSHAAAEELHVQLVALEIKQIQLCDFEFATCRWPQRATKIDNLIVVNVKPGHSEMALRLPGFFFKANSFAFGIELNHAITFRVANLIAENARAALDSERVAIEIKFPVENIITENERCARVPDKLCADQKCLGDPFRFWLLGVLDANTELRAVPEIIFQHRQIFWRRDDEYLAQSAQHQSRKRIADHRLVVNRKKLFADDFRQWKKTRPGAAGEKNGLFHFRVSICDFRSLQLQRKSNCDHCCQNFARPVK